VELMCSALRPFTTVSDGELRLLGIGLLGAAEAIAREMQTGAVSRDAAADALSSLIARNLDA
jgi:hypothetical protein